MNVSNVSYSFVRLRALHVTDLLPSLALLLHVLGEENHFGHYGQLRQWLCAEVAVLQGLGPDETDTIISIPNQKSREQM